MLHVNGFQVTERDGETSRPVVDGSHRYQVVDALAPHIYQLAPKLRAEDLAEIEGTGNTAKRSLWRGYRNSILCKTAFIDDEVAAMWGLCVGGAAGVTLLSDIGRPWLLTSAAVEQLPFAVVREARRAVRGMLISKPILENYVLSSYTRAVRMLRIIGFTVDEPVPLPPKGVLYSRFHMER